MALTQRMYQTSLRTTTILGFAFLWWPFLCVICLGQSSLVITYAIVKGWDDIRSGRSYRGGFWWGLAASIKLFPALLGLYLLLARNWRAIFGMLGIFMTVLALCLLVVSFNDLVFYVVHVIPADVQQWSPYPLNSSLYGLLLPLLTDNPYIKPIISLPFDTALSWIQFAAIAFVLWSARIVSNLIRSHDAEGGFHIVLMVMLLVSPITWAHIFPVLLPTLAFICVRHTGRHTRIWLLVALICISLPDIPIARALVGYFSPSLVPYEAFLLIRVTTVGLFVLLFLLVKGRLSAIQPSGSFSTKSMASKGCGSL